MGATLSIVAAMIGVTASACVHINSFIRGFAVCTPCYKCFVPGLRSSGFTVTIAHAVHRICPGGWDTDDQAADDRNIPSVCATGDRVGSDGSTVGHRARNTHENTERGVQRHHLRHVLCTEICSVIVIQNNSEWFWNSDYFQNYSESFRIWFWNSK